MGLRAIRLANPFFLEKHGLWRPFRVCKSVSLSFGFSSATGKEIMVSTTLIAGGCRSGKSRQALTLGEEAAGRRNLFIATCQPHDAEMAARITHHQQERGRRWKTVEAPLEPDQVIANQGPGADVILIDCLTLWISNLMMAHPRDEEIMQAVDRLHRAVVKPPCPIILVTNEVGAGIVPENPMARRFRDLAGWCNQRMADACNRVIWMVAGIAVPIKGAPH
jgi:adenosylcobinamide kinase/adenosylcobinamide-phosphate guanylyltransferase